MRMRSVSGRLAIVAAGAALLAGGCGGDDEPEPTPADEVRSAATTYLGALREREWERACGLMTAGARRELEEVVGGECAEALEAGGALPPEQLATIRRELRGAKVQVKGDAASIGPLGALGEPLRLERSDDRWLIAG